MTVIWLSFGYSTAFWLNDWLFGYLTVLRLFDCLSVISANSLYSDFWLSFRIFDSLLAIRLSFRLFDYFGYFTVVMAV